MTTDAFTTAARAEAERRHIPMDRPTAITERVAVQGFVAGAEWTRDHLAAQEPTDAEVEAAARAIALCDQIDFGDLVRRGHGLAGQYRRQAHAALTAAKEAR